MKMILFVSVLLSAFQVSAQELKTYNISIKNHLFSQSVIEVKANEKFKLVIKNEDPSSEEFESNAMMIEKFIGPNKTITVTLGPLKPGTYDFMGEFHQNTAKGQVIAK